VEGLVEVRIGSGIYVQATGNTASGKGGGRAGGRTGPDDGGATAGPFELLRARYVIEGETAALAAKSAKKGQVQAIEESLEAMKHELDEDKQPLDSDRMFHMRIAEATGNGALVAVVDMLWEDRTGPLYKQLEHHYDSPGLWHAAMNEHRAVLKAIAAKDAAGARSAMQRHLNQAYKRFSTGWDTVTGQK
jgi:DNA-binding FadR family transcriptional regulator